MANQTLQGNSQFAHPLQHLHQQASATTLSQTAALNGQSTSTSSQTNSLQDIRLYPSNPQTGAEMRSQMQSQPASDQQLQAQPQETCGRTATAQFLQNVNLVAEAAKRAQMGILMRDFEEISFD
ncbi:hypothetical protein MGYG_00703 [Nannizzia gypsea CBS 118893]|uniref:Thiol methyltransferase n=1 Tax=Arthroderma gypseum (strain ATCC MYA-4604 / CBS 118893) TaxID=535722 RepID=E5R1B2_ARTGP|nr:hypothetical protein MGYG_00703 [Nannizzia gypsea CBS 118893]EFQ97663.1 hypothetical protein MGYG_00703 [Nannizzia gypsea CBS 118893]